MLDEPSIGLHQRDNRRLIDTLTRLRDLGNTVIVVEHDEETIRESDWIVDIGPGAGEHGGEVVYSGPVKGIERVKESVTGQYLAGKRSIPVPAERRPPQLEKVTIHGAREHNLKDLTIDIPPRLLRGRHGRVGLGQVDPRPRHLPAGPDAEDLQVEDARR